MFNKCYISVKEEKPKKKRNKKLIKFLNVLVLLLHSRVLRYGVLFAGLARIIWLGVNGLLETTNPFVLLGIGCVWFIWDLFASAGYDTGDYMFNTIDDDEDEEEIVIKKEEQEKELEKEKTVTEGSIIRDYKEIAKEKSEYVSLLELVEKYKKLTNNETSYIPTNESTDTLDTSGYSYMKK